MRNTAAQAAQERISPAFGTHQAYKLNLRSLVGLGLVEPAHPKLARYSLLELEQA
jgi:hypothetical protein